MSTLVGENEGEGQASPAYQNLTKPGMVELFAGNAPDDWSRARVYQGRITELLSQIRRYMRDLGMNP